MIAIQALWVWQKIKKDSIKDYYKSIKVKVKHPKIEK